MSDVQAGPWLATSPDSSIVHAFDDASLIAFCGQPDLTYSTHNSPQWLTCHECADEMRGRINQYRRMLGGTAP